VQFHTHDRWKLSFALILGVALAAAIVLVETSGHEHTQRHNAGTSDVQPPLAARS
jgi:predicted outer membrane lipoprotein